MDAISRMPINDWEKWLHVNIGDRSRWWITHYGFKHITVAFKHEADATIFKLRFGIPGV